MNQKYHLLQDFNIHKSTIKKNFADNDRTGPEAELVQTLLDRETQYYSLPELKLLFGYLWTAHDDCVQTNPDEFSPLQVYQAERKINNGQQALNKLIDLANLKLY